jgi:hypothetical protein
MRLSGAFNLVLKFVAFGRQKSRNLIDASHTPGTERRSVIYGLADLEFVIAHSILHRNWVGLDTCGA